jgi:hypothetical protein
VRPTAAHRVITPGSGDNNIVMEDPAQKFDGAGTTGSSCSVFVDGNPRVGQAERWTLKSS